MNTIVWFRKGLRLHDNPAFVKSLDAPRIFPVFVIDPHFVKPANVGLNRMNFLLESLRDLDANLSKIGSRLIVLRGNPVEVFPEVFKKWNIRRIAFEKDTEPYAKMRDAKVTQIASDNKVEVVSVWSHTLYNLDQLSEIFTKDHPNQSKAPTSYQTFLKVVNKAGKPSQPLGHISEHVKALPSLDDVIPNTDYSIPTLTELGYPEIDPQNRTFFVGGETEGLKRMEKYLLNKQKVATFSKPDTDPTAFLEPDTTALSPYLKFGCVSPRLFYSKLQEILQESKKKTDPPVSLVGQLLWREFFYLCGHKIENFDKIEGNPICRKIPWKDNEAHLEAWSKGETGYPWIDAVMKQLHRDGWMHHLARHCVACFLTRGDLYISWEKGVKVFDQLLVDADWSLNNANWMWLSASAFFNQYWRVYSPVTFAKKYDKDGKFIREFLPQLKDFPAQYIYEPWTAPLSVQQKAKCIIGKDYPKPIVDHKKVSKENMDAMKLAYGGSAQEEEAENDNNNNNKKRPRSKVEKGAVVKKKKQ